MTPERELREQLIKAVTVLCETRGHAGRRPCQFCTDMHLWILAAAPAPTPVPPYRYELESHYTAAEPQVEGCDNEVSITIRGQEQVAIVMEALRKAGFVHAQAAPPPASLRAEEERK